MPCWGVLVLAPARECRGLFASDVDLWGVALGNGVYLGNCSIVGCRILKKIPGLVLLGFPFPSDGLLLLAHQSLCLGLRPLRGD